MASRRPLSGLGPLPSPAATAQQAANHRALPPATPAPPKRLSMKAFALRSCLYSTSSVLLRCRYDGTRRVVRFKGKATTHRSGSTWASGQDAARVTTCCSPPAAGAPSRAQRSSGLPLSSAHPLASRGAQLAQLPRLALDLAPQDVKALLVGQPLKQVWRILALRRRRGWRRLALLALGHGQAGPPLCLCARGAKVWRGRLNNEGRRQALQWRRRRRQWRWRLMVLLLPRCCCLTGRMLAQEDTAGRRVCVQRRWQPDCTAACGVGKKTAQQKRLKSLKVIVKGQEAVPQPQARTRSLLTAPEDTRQRLMRSTVMSKLLGNACRAACRSTVSTTSAARTSFL